MTTDDRTKRSYGRGCSDYAWRKLDELRHQTVREQAVFIAPTRAEARIAAAEAVGEEMAELRKLAEALALSPGYIDGEFNGRCDGHVSGCVLAEKLLALIAALEQAQEDSRRLDALESHPVFRDTEANGNVWYCVMANGVQLTAQSLCDLADAILAQQEQAQ